MKWTSLLLFIFIGQNFCFVTIGIIFLALGKLIRNCKDLFIIGLAILLTFKSILMFLLWFIQAKLTYFLFPINGLVLFNCLIGGYIPISHVEQIDDRS